MSVKRARVIRNRLASDRRGAMVIETALVAPVLVVLALGGFEISQIVSRQHELQSGIAEAEAIALAANAGASTDTDGLRSTLAGSLSLDEEQVTVEKLYRCNADIDKVSEAADCPDGAVVTSYVQITLHDTYTPMWAKFGVGKPFKFDLIRSVQLS